MAQTRIDTMVVNIAVAVMRSAVALSLALLTGLGGRQVAGELAAGRAWRSSLRPGTESAPWCQALVAAKARRCRWSGSLSTYIRPLLNSIPAEPPSLFRTRVCSTRSWSAIGRSMGR